MPVGPPTATPVPAWPLGATAESRPRFSWSAVAGTRTYDLRVLSASGLTVALEQAGVADTSFSAVAALPAGVEFIWSVRAESEFGPGPFSEPAHFTIVPGAAPAPDQPPVASVSHTGACAAAGCSVTFQVTATDPDGDPLTTTWSGCAAGSGSSLVCTRASEGALAAQALVEDGRGGSATVADSASVSVASYSVGTWSPCAATGAFTCTSNAPDGCTRPGTKSRSVTAASWALDAGASVSPPLSEKACTEKVQGYVAGYDATYTSWTCTSGGANGCAKDLLGYSVSGYRATAPDAPVPAARIYATGYVASWAVSDWSACSASCGGGWHTRSTMPASWKAMPPDAPRPSDSELCNTDPCRLTCYDYGLYPTWDECYGAGWSFCDTRYHDDGAGGLITCRHGYE
jgi:hypothetical protein